MVRITASFLEPDVDLDFAILFHLLLPAGAFLSTVALRRRKCEQVYIYITESSLIMSMAYNNSFWDLRKKYPTITNVTTGENQAGMKNPKLSKIIISPKNKTEYIAPFFKYLYFLIRSMFPTVSLRKIYAPKPLPKIIKGTENVNANAPTTPSMENVASKISK